MRLSLVLAIPIWLFASFAQSQPVDSLATTTIWEFSPNYSTTERYKGFGMVPLFDDATHVGAVNFYCAVPPRDPYLDIYAYKNELSVTNDERRWPVLTADTVLRFENVSVPVSIEQGFIFIDINSQTEYVVRRIFDISGDQPVERIFQLPGFVKLKLTFRPVKIGNTLSSSSDVSFAEMLDLCKTARKSMTAPSNRKAPRR
jgi:hypothetical protein